MQRWFILALVSLSLSPTISFGIMCGSEEVSAEVLPRLILWGENHFNKLSKYARLSLKRAIEADAVIVTSEVLLDEEGGLMLFPGSADESHPNLSSLEDIESWTLRNLVFNATDAIKILNARGSERGKLRQDFARRVCFSVNNFRLAKEAYMSLSSIGDNELDNSIPINDPTLDMTTNGYVDAIMACNPATENIPYFQDPELDSQRARDTLALVAKAFDIAKSEEIASLDGINLNFPQDIDGVTDPSVRLTTDYSVNISPSDIKSWQKKQRFASTDLDLTARNRGMAQNIIDTLCKNRGTSKPIIALAGAAHHNGIAFWEQPKGVTVEHLLESSGVRYEGAFDTHEQSDHMETVREIQELTRQTQ